MDTQNAIEPNLVPPHTENLAEKELAAWHARLKEGYLNNFYSLFPNGFKTIGLRKWAAAADEASVKFASELRLCDTIEETMTEIDTKQLLDEKNLINRLAKIRSTKVEDLDENDRKFLTEYFRLYEALIQKGKTHQELTG